MKPEITSSQDFAKWLEDKTPLIACVVSVRIALRVVPILREALYADATARREEILLPCFRVLAAACLAGAGVDQFREVRQAVRKAARKANDAMSETYEGSQFAVVEGMETVPEFPRYIKDLREDSNALGTAIFAVNAIELAVRTAAEMVDARVGIASSDAVLDSATSSATAAINAIESSSESDEFTFDEGEDNIEDDDSSVPVFDFWKAVQLDAKFLESKTIKESDPKNSAREILQSPLWPQVVPIWASRLWTDLKDELPIEEGWADWIDWYETRLAGQLWTPESESHLLALALEKGQQEYSSANLDSTDQLNSKNAQAPTTPLEAKSNNEYQVALTFAGEQREYAEEVARHLSAKSIPVFYDGFEIVKLWGKDGTEVFHEVFAEQATYVVMFISSAYARKCWTRIERRAALSRMMQQEREYILPVRFDDTRIPGLAESTLYVDGNRFSPAEIATMVASKLGITAFQGKASDIPAPRMTSPIGEVAFDYSNYNGRFIIGAGTREFETKWTKASNTSIYVTNDPDSINGVALAAAVSSIHQVAKAAELDYTSRVRTVGIGQVVVLRNCEGFYAAIQVTAIKDDKRGDDCDELRFRYAIQTDGTDSFEELHENLWQ